MKKLFMLIILILSMSIYAFNEYEIGKSVEGRSITVAEFGQGETALVLVGGIHGKFEPSAIQLMQEFKKYFNDYSMDIKLYIIENLNPDSFFVETDISRNSSTGFSGDDRIGNTWYRYNSKYIDLNRNWDTENWYTDAIYGSNSYKEGAGGEHPMSEPEVQALASFLELKKSEHETMLVINYHAYVASAGLDGMAQPSYSGCFENMIVDEFADEFAKLYASASGYEYIEKWTKYEIYGEFLNWAGDNNIPAIDIELSNTNDVYHVQSDNTTHFELNLNAVTSIIEELEKF